MAGDSIAQRTFETDGARPIYLQIVETLRREIQDGTVAVGDLLPSESSLRDRFTVSRHTIREALRTLKNEGVIESRQGAGSRVLAPATPIYTYSVNSIAELVQYATEAQYQISNSAIVVANSELAERLGSIAGTRWLRVEGFRYLKDSTVPVCWTEVYILSEYSGVGVIIGRRAGTIYSFIEEMYNVRFERIQQSISACDMPPDVVGELDVDPASLAILVKRTYRLADDTTALVAMNYHVPRRLRLDWTMHRSTAQS